MNLVFGIRRSRQNAWERSFDVQTNVTSPNVRPSTPTSMSEPSRFWQRRNRLNVLGDRPTPNTLSIGIQSRLRARNYTAFWKRAVGMRFEWQQEDLLTCPLRPRTPLVGRVFPNRM